MKHFSEFAVNEQKDEVEVGTGDDHKENNHPVNIKGRPERESCLFGGESARRHGGEGMTDTVKEGHSPRKSKRTANAVSDRYINQMLRATSWILELTRSWVTPGLPH